MKNGVTTNRKVGGAVTARGMEMRNSKAWLRGASLVFGLVALPVLVGSVGATAENVGLTAYSRSTIVLAQAAVTTTNPPPADYLMKYCTLTEHTKNLRSALRSVDPAGAVRNYIERVRKTPLNIAEFKPTLLQGPRHGTLDQEAGNDATKNMPPQIAVFYAYTPETGFLGKDRAVFMVEYQGKHFKVVADIHVLEIVDPYDSRCPARNQVIKLRKPSRRDAGESRAL